VDDRAPKEASEERGGTAVLQGVLTALSLLAGAAALGPVAVVVGVASFVALLTSVLRGGGVGLPPPSLSFTWVKSAAARVAPMIPFAVPFVVFLAVTKPLASESESLQFQQQASEIIPVLLVGFVLETGAIEWSKRRVDWILSLMTVLILLLGETFALVSLATNDREHADMVAGSIAAGAAAILIAAVLGSARHQQAPRRT
jgi:hypothetical protein